MWVFDLLDASGAMSVTVPLLEGIHTLGRKDASISFPEDRSVSRKHAEVRVGPVPRNDPSKQPVLVKDVGSKLKTLVNGVDTGEADREVSLEEGDEVKVGTTGSIMRLRFQPLRLCGTLLMAEDKVKLKALAKKCGGVMATRKWDPATSTHLVTPPSPTTVTEKLVLAVLAVKPAVHMGWLQALVEAGASKPLKPVPDVAKFGPVVTRGRQGSFLIQVNHARRNALKNDFFVAVRKNDLVENIIENAGGDLVRAYSMSDADFAGQDWRRRAGDRNAHFVVEASPDEPVPAKSEAAFHRRVEALEGAGMEAADKQQLAEAVVYIQDLNRVRQSMAMRASSSSAAAMAMHTASEAWGPSQSLASSSSAAAAAAAATASAAAAAVPSSQTAAAAPPMPPPTGSGGKGKSKSASSSSNSSSSSSDGRALPKPSKPDAVAATPAAALGTPGPPKAPRESAEEAEAGGAAAAASEPSKAVAKMVRVEGDNGGAESPLDGGRRGDGGGGGAGVPEGGPETAAAAKGEGEKTRSMQKWGREEEEQEEQEKKGGGVDGGGGAVAVDEDKNAAAAPAVDDSDNPRVPAAAQAGGAGRDDDDNDDNPADPADTTTAATAATTTAARVGKEAAGRAPSLAGEGVIGDDGEGGDGHGNGGGGRAQVGVETHRDDAGGVVETGAGGRGDGSGSGSGSGGKRDAKRKKLGQGQASGKADEEGSGGPAERGPQRGVPVPAVPGGWMTSHNASPQVDKRSKERGRRGSSQGQTASGAHEQERDDQMDEEERVRLATPLEAAVTEKRRLVVKVLTARSAARGYSGACGRVAGRGGAAPNFKRFKKNTVLFGGEHSTAYVPLAALRSTLPKESERELALAEEQQQLEREEADADRLFTQGGTGRGVNARAPQGRTRRR